MAPGPRPREDGRSGLRAAAALAAVLAIGTAARLVGWTQVFTADGIRFLFDTDPLYHLLQAQRALANHLSPTWLDPALDWPFGAQVPWPPLWDLVLAGTARLLGGAAASAADVEKVGAIAPVVVGVVTLPLVAALGRVLLGRGRGTWAALVVALVMAHVWYTAVGRPDQHALEILLSCGILLGVAAGALGATRVRRAAGVAVAGAGLALAHWNWMGSALNLVVPLAFAAVAHVVLEPGHAARIARAVALALGAAAALLAASVAAWGPPGALGSGSLLSVTGLHVAVIACGAVFTALLLVARRLAPSAGPRRRAGEVLAAGALAAALALGASSAVREGIVRGLVALGAANPWYENISEFRRLLFSCERSLAGDLSIVRMLYGLTLPAALLAIPPLARRWRDPDERPRVLLLACWGAIYVALALLRRRFAPYAGIPVALLAVEGLALAAAAVAARLLPRARHAAAVLLGLGMAAVVAPSTAALAQGHPEIPAAHVDAARWLARQPDRDGQEGVLTSWTVGHLVQYYARKPVIASPFGTEGGADAMAFTTRFDLAPDAETAERLLLARRVGWVVLVDPIIDAPVDQGLAPPGSPRIAVVECSLSEGRLVGIEPAFLDLAAARLYHFDGLSRPEAPAQPFTRVRLVYESAPDAAAGPNATPVKIFQVVPGATLRIAGLPPSGPVQALATIRTNAGRDLVWSVGATATASGAATLRVPYATGQNGAVRVGWVVIDGRTALPISIAEEDVLEGRDVTVVTGSATGTARR